MVGVGRPLAKQGHRVLSFQILGFVLQIGRLQGSRTDGEMIVKYADAGADMQRTAGEFRHGLPDAHRALDHIVPRAHQKHIVAAGIDDGQLQRRLAAVLS